MISFAEKSNKEAALEKEAAAQHWRVAVRRHPMPRGKGGAPARW